MRNLCSVTIYRTGFHLEQPKEKVKCGRPNPSASPKDAMGRVWHEFPPRTCTAATGQMKLVAAWRKWLWTSLWVESASVGSSDLRELRGVLSVSLAWLHVVASFASIWVCLKMGYTKICGWSSYPYYRFKQPFLLRGKPNFRQTHLPTGDRLSGSLGRCFVWASDDSSGLHWKLLGSIGCCI